MIGEIKDVEIKQATADDIRLFYPGGSPRTCYAWMATYKGAPACLAGLIVERGGCTAFSEIKSGIDAPKKTIWRTAKVLLEHIKSIGLPMVAACEKGNLKTQNFVQKLGFHYHCSFKGSETFIWR